MSKSAQQTSPRAAMNVVRTMHRELQRQVRDGGLTRCDGMDANGQVVIEGKLDLAVLAYMLELTLRREFPSLGPKS